jgi:hypothetical protein
MFLKFERFSPYGDCPQVAFCANKDCKGLVQDFIKMLLFVDGEFSRLVVEKGIEIAGRADKMAVHITNLPFC